MFPQYDGQSYCVTQKVVMHPFLATSETPESYLLSTTIRLVRLSYLSNSALCLFFCGKALNALIITDPTQYANMHWERLV